MKTLYNVVSEYDRLDADLQPEDRRIEIDRRVFDSEEDAVAFAKSLPCDIYMEPLDIADGTAVYAIQHRVIRVDMDYDGFPVDTVLVGCRRLPDEQLPGAVKAHQSGVPARKFKARWFPAQASCPPAPHDGAAPAGNVDISIRVPAALFKRLAMAAAARGKSPEQLALDILDRETSNGDADERPDTAAPQPEPSLADNGMGVDWEE